ncbi:MAG: LytTR family transcriptional regulator, partial [Anaerovoracaceae bacterium]
MKISVQLDNKQKEIEVIIKTAAMDDNVNSIIEKLSDEKPKIILGFIDNKAKILEENNIIRIYSANKKVYAIT